MKTLKGLIRYLSATILGIALACAVSPAAADITYQVATYLADTTYFRADTSTLTFPRVLALKAQTADGSDNGNLCFSGGGNTGSQGRGSYVCSNGNESSNGAVQIAEGSNGGGVAITAGATTFTGDHVISTTAKGIRTDTSDGTDNKYIYISGGGAHSNARGAYLNLRGNEDNSGYAQLTSGDAGGFLYLDTAAAAGKISIRPNGTAAINFLASFLFESAAAGNETTGAGSAALGTNSPAVTNTAPYKWFKVKTQDGSTAYIPAWK